MGLTVLYLTSLLLISPAFFDVVQQRKGMLLYDPILSAFPAMDVSNIIFSTLYLFTIITIITIVPDPVAFLHGLVTYALITTIRFGTMFFISLEPPPGLVELKDPVLNIFFYGHTVITKDLFFSGHASTLFLFFFLAKQKVLRMVLLAAAIGLSLLLLIQHIHYSYDIVAAPVFAFLACRISWPPLKRFADGNV